MTHAHTYVYIYIYTYTEGIVRVFGANQTVVEAAIEVIRQNLNVRYIHVCVYIYMFMCIIWNVCVNVCVYVYMRLCVCVYVYACIYMCVYVCM